MPDSGTSSNEFRPLARPDGSDSAKPLVAGPSIVSRTETGAADSSGGARTSTLNEGVLL